MEKAEAVGLARAETSVERPADLVDDALQPKQRRDTLRLLFLEVDREAERGCALIRRQPNAKLAALNDRLGAPNRSDAPLALSLALDGEVQQPGELQADA